MNLMEHNERPKSSPRDVFLHLLTIVALYASASAFLTLAFQLVNLWFPDILAGGYYAAAGARSAIRWALASLIVIFPVYLFTARFLRKEYEKEPEKRELRVRKWLTSFTLFVVALTMIGDLVSLLSHFFEGELTTRFVLKVVAVAFVAGAIGAYYLWILKARPVTVRARAFAIGILTVVVAAVVTGFFHAGSPSEERVRRIDEQRVSDLQMIQGQVVSYWQAKEKLPEDLNALTDGIRGYTNPTDPETGAAYEYRTVEPRSFELCATFDRKSTDILDPSLAAMPRAPYDAGIGMMNWNHDAGRYCFTRTIDPDFYPPLKN